MSKQSEVNWIKAIVFGQDKPHPKKSITLISSLNLQPNQSKRPYQEKPNPFSTFYENINQDSSEESRNSDDVKANKLTIKDLCQEDKTRIANLIKELAKIAEEKKQIEVSLEEERKQKDSEIKEVLKQQEALLADKESLIKKFSKTQQKLFELQKQKIEHQNQNKTEHSLPPRPAQSQSQKQQKPNLQLAEKKSKLNDQQSSNDIFNPFRSSTPKNLSPRSISPISNENENKQNLLGNDPSISGLNEPRDDDDLRKLQLIKERMELAEEQKKLKSLLESQEETLRDKQAQIMMQQKIHLERLEELSRIKASNQHQIIHIPNQINPQMVPFSNLNQFIPQMNQCPENFFTQLNSNQNRFMINSEQFVNAQMNQAEQNKIIRSNELDDESLESLATIVYKKMMLKKKTDKANTKLKNQKQIDLSCCSSISKQDNDESLIDLIIEESKSLNSLNCNKKSQISRTDFNFNDNHDVDLEESKLLEDLFFIK